jgi:hypothetical protein
VPPRTAARVTDLVDVMASSLPRRVSQQDDPAQIYKTSGAPAQSRIRCAH